MASELVTTKVSPRLDGVCAFVPVPPGRAHKTPNRPEYLFLVG